MNNFSARTNFLGNIANLIQRQFAKNDSGDPYLQAHFIRALYQRYLVARAQ